MRVRRRLVVSVLVAVAVAGSLSGCTSEQREVERVASQEAQLREYVEQADAWGGGGLR
jgi:outer membrane murein-binding lipoprotein Lpp